MYILANAVKNLFRNKGRNILIAAVSLAIIISSVVTLTIGNASSKIIEDTRLRIGSKVNIAINLAERGRSGTPGPMPVIGVDEFFSYAESGYLSKSILSARLYIYSDSTFAVDDDSKGQGIWESNDGSGEEPGKAGTMVLIGNSDPETLVDFKAGGGREILPGGRMYSGLDECIISSDLAELNGISVGDTIFARSVFKPVKNLELNVTGIYSDKLDAYPGPAYEEAKFFVFNRRNEVITSFETVKARGFETDKGMEINAEYYLKNPDDISKFEAEVRAKGLPSDYSVSIDQEELDGITGPLKGMSRISLTFMIVILVLGGFVLILLSFIAVRERKYEVGVLRAMGMEKSKIAFGLLAEAIMISLICLVIGLGIGSAVSQPIADSILSGQVEAAAVKAKADSEDLKFLVMDGKTQLVSGLNAYTPVSEIQVALNANTAAQIALIALALAALSAVIGIAVITKYEPLKILRERN